MPVAGHVPRAVGLEGVLTGSQSCIEHLDGYLGWTGTLSDAQIAERVKWTRLAGVANCPTLVVYDKFAQIDDVDRLRKRPEMRFMPPVLRATWDPKTDFRLRGLRPGQQRRRPARGGDGCR